MASTQSAFVARPIDEVKRELLERAQENRNPFLYTIFQEVAPVINGLRSVGREEWAKAFGALAAPHEERAAKAEAAGDADLARKEYLIAYDCNHVARYPAPNSPGKVAAYRKSQEYFHKAARYFDPPLERVEMPFNGRPEEGKVSVGLLRKPKGVVKPPVVVVWGGIDAFKEERASDPYLRAGLAPLAIDMPGVADAPLAGSEDGERLWDAVFDYIASRPDLDADRVGIHGGSTGGYWATKVAHTHAARLRAAVNQGGPAHFAFQKDWIVKAQRGEYPFELAETLAAPSAARRRKNGSSMRRGFHCSIKEFSTSPARPCSASTASMIAFFRLPICICCLNMAVQKRRVSIPAATWAAAMRKR